MKVLIAFHSDTGNTKRIADAVHEELASDHEVEIRTFAEIAPTDLDEFALVFVGTPIHTGGLSEPARDFLERLSPSPDLALAGLVTHASSAFSRENYEQGLGTLASTAEQNGIRYLGCFDCQGRLDPAIQPIAQQQQRVTDEDWAKRMADADTHPDAADDAQARTFAAQVVASI